MSAAVKKISVPEYQMFKVRLWKNAFEMVCQDIEKSGAICGWSELFLKNLECLDLARKLVATRSKKLAREVYKNPPKESMKFLASLVANGVDFEVEDRTNLVINGV